MQNRHKEFEAMLFISCLFMPHDFSEQCGKVWPNPEDRFTELAAVAGAGFLELVWMES